MQRAPAAVRAEQVDARSRSRARPAPVRRPGHSVCGRRSLRHCDSPAPAVEHDERTVVDHCAQVAATGARSQLDVAPRYTCSPQDAAPSEERDDGTRAATRSRGECAAGDPDDRLNLHARAPSAEVRTERARQPGYARRRKAPERCDARCNDVRTPVPARRLNGCAEPRAACARQRLVRERERWQNDRAHAAVSSLEDESPRDSVTPERRGQRGPSRKGFGTLFRRPGPA